MKLAFLQSLYSGNQIALRQPVVSTQLKKASLAIAFLLIQLSVFAQAFVHPELLHTQADFTRMQTKVAANAQPWKGSWDILVANSHSSLTY